MLSHTQQVPASIQNSQHGGHLIIKFVTKDDHVHIRTVIHFLMLSDADLTVSLFIPLGGSSG